MSHYDWEAGTLLLPSAEARRVRDAVRAAADNLAGRLYAEAQVFWQRLPARAKRNANAYMDEITRADLDEPLEELLWRCAQPMPRRAKQADVSNLIGKRTGANPTFLLGEARIEFHGREVRWSSGENNHQVERAHSHPLAMALFSALQTVRWTRGTGGTLVGNDEYNSDSSSEGGGANYVTARYGPKGGLR